MARPTTKPRVPALDPEREAIRFVRRVLEHLRSVRALLDPLTGISSGVLSDAQLKRTRLYRDLVRVAQYAVGGEGAGRADILRLERLEPLLQAPLLLYRDFATVLASIDPDEEDDPMKLLLAAALARAQLDDGTSAVTSSQLAMLAGVTRRHVGAEIREGRLDAEIAGRRGTAGAALIRPEEAQRWLRDRRAGDVK
jgi:hypothetical protein